MNVHEQRQVKLRAIVNNAQENPNVQDFIIRQATGILASLGMNHGHAEKYIRFLVHGPILDDLTVFEQKVHDFLLERSPVYQSLAEAMGVRADMVMGKIRNCLHGDFTTLDLGGGSGEIANRIRKHTHAPVTIADPLDYGQRHAEVDFRLIQGSTIEAEGREFYQTTVLTVFHHADDVEKLVAEAFRVTKKRVIIIESVTPDRFSYLYGCWIDWFYNHIILFQPEVEKKINVPCNFLPSSGWENLIFKLTGLHPTISESLGIYQWLNPEHHHLLVYDKK